MTRAPQTFVRFCERTLPITLTLGQRTLARVGIDGIDPCDLTDPADRDMARRLFGPVETIPDSARGVLDVNKGARIGGSFIFGAVYSLWRALTAELATGPGEIAVAMVVAPDLDLARQIINYVSGLCEQVPAIRARVEGEDAYSVTLRRPDGRMVAVKARAASRGGSALRGRTLVSAVLSEAAFFRDANSVVNDEDCYRAVAPRVVRGGMVVLESTPWAETGLHYRLFTDNWGDPRTAIAALAPTELMRDDEHTLSLVARERERDSDNASREFDAQFLTVGSGLFLGPALLKPAVCEDDQVRTDNDGVTYVGGDVGLVSDASAFVAVRVWGDLIMVLDILELRPSKGAPLKLSEVIRQACDFASRHNVRTITTDHHEIVAAQEHVPEGYSLEACEGGADAKAERFMRLRDSFRAEQVRIPRRHMRLVTQLGYIISKPRPGGGTQFVFPRRGGTHMDVCAAFVLAATQHHGHEDWARVARNNRRLWGMDRTSGEPPLEYGRGEDVDHLSRWFDHDGRGFG